MSIETYRAIASVAAKELLKEWGNKANETIVEEYVRKELPGLDSDQVDTVIKFTNAYVSIADINVYFDIYEVADDGHVLSREEAEATFEASVTF